MKEIFLISLLTPIVKVWSVVYNYRLNQSFLRLKDLVFTIWIRNFIGKVGENVVIHRGVSFYGIKNITIGDNTIVQNYTSIYAHYQYKEQTFTPVILIGKNCNIGPYNHITSVNKIVLKDGVLTGNRVTISDNNHGSFCKKDLVVPPAERDVVTKKDVEIGENVWVGDNACILSGVHIGKGCVVAANAVVTKDVPPYCLVAGVPAKIIKFLNDEG